MTKLNWIDWVLTLVTSVVLLDVGILQLFDFSLVKTIAFNLMWLVKTFYLTAGVVGFVTLIRLVRKTF